MDRREARHRDSIRVTTLLFLPLVLVLMAPGCREDGGADAAEDPRLPYSADEMIRRAAIVLQKNGHDPACYEGEIEFGDRHPAVRFVPDDCEDAYPVRVCSVDGKVLTWEAGPASWNRYQRSVRRRVLDEASSRLPGLESAPGFWLDILEEPGLVVAVTGIRNGNGEVRQALWVVLDKETLGTIAVQPAE